MIILCFCSAADALEPSPKRDCAICHIMWLDEFRTSEETLIEWQPGNVLMKDSQGVVSSEDICYSCHDGYVCDSREKVWKNGRHSTFVTPSEKIKVPGSLSLSNKGEIYCGTCHSPHGIGSAPSVESGRTSFFRVSNVDSRLCEMCHTNERDFKSTNGHPLHTTAIKLPKEMFELGSKRAKEKNSVICQSCHIVHGAEGNKITIIDNSKSDLCMLCHEKRFIVSTKHDLRLTMPDSKNTKNQSLSKSGPCGACHVPHNSGGKRLWARDIGKGLSTSWKCLSCHDNDSGDQIKSTGKYSHPININLDSKSEVPNELPLFKDIEKKDVGGTVQCFTCHNVHQWDPDHPDNKGGKETEGDASNSFLRVNNSSSSALCVKCHKKKIAVTFSDHNLQITAPEAVNIHGFNANTSGPCGACHVPHNAESKYLWAKTFFNEDTSAIEVCTGCHDKDGPARKKTIGDNFHPINIEYETKKKLETKHTKTLLPLYNDMGKSGRDGKIVCLTCHEPHHWDSRVKTDMTNYSKINIEGDATNSFLRKKCSPTPDLCGICHEESVVVVGTDHDLNVTYPKAVNILGQTVKESGQCGVCHLVHNSPNKLKLWARTYGPVPKDENMMNALCTSCHTKGEIAENKCPPVASHPTGKLINNIMNFNRKSKKYTPIFNSDGDEVNVGDLSCPSCHSFSKWAPHTNKKGANKNIEGDAMNSFLRTFSDNTVCRDCHGESSILRYKHFHSMEKRTEMKESNKEKPPVH